MRSSISWSGRLILVLAGALMLLVGLGVRSHELDYEDKVDRWVETPDGTVTIYQLPDGEMETRYEITEVDESEAAVFAVHEELDVRVEVFRGDAVQARSKYGSGEAGLFVEMVEIDAATAGAYLGDEGSDLWVELFRGTPAEVEEWLIAAENRALDLAFEGSRRDAEAWVDARTDPRDDALSWIVFTAAAVLLLVALVLGWGRGRARTPRKLLDRSLGIAGATVAFIAVGVSIFESANPDTAADFVRELAAALSMLTFVLFAAIVVRHRESHRGEAGSDLITSGVWIAVGLAAFGFLQALDPILRNKGWAGLTDMIAPDDVTFLALLFGVPLVLASIGLLRDGEDPLLRRRPARTTGPTPPRGAAPMT